MYRNDKVLVYGLKSSILSNNDPCEMCVIRPGCNKICSKKILYEDHIRKDKPKEQKLQIKRIKKRKRR